MRRSGSAAWVPTFGGMKGFKAYRLSRSQAAALATALALGSIGRLRIAAPVWASLLEQVWARVSALR